jgi:hypothetical protein
MSFSFHGLSVSDQNAPELHFFSDLVDAITLDLIFFRNVPIGQI